MNRPEILTYPDVRLREPSRPVDLRTNPEVIEDIKRAKVALDLTHGVGISGVQIGSHYRFFIIRVNEQDEVVVNPSFRVEEEWKPYGMSEGCLSFPGLYTHANRYFKILATYESLKTVPDINSLTLISDEVMDGLRAHVFQHELEHLDGKLLIDHTTGPERKRMEKKMAKWTSMGIRYP